MLGHPDMSALTPTSTSAPAVTHCHAPSAEMPPTCNEHHITVMALPIELGVSPLGTDKACDSGTLHFGAMFSVASVTKELSKSRTLKHHTEEETHQTMCEAAHLEMQATSCAA